MRLFVEAVAEAGLQTLTWHLQRAMKARSEMVQLVIEWPSLIRGIQCFNEISGILKP